MKVMVQSDLVFTGKLNEIILENLGNEDFDVIGLARAVGMSRFNLNRKLHFICRKTISQYIREVRLKKAMELLKDENVTASEVAFKVGFSSPAYFSTCFSEYYGYPPGEARKRSLMSIEKNGAGSPTGPSAGINDSLQYRAELNSGKKVTVWAISAGSILIVIIAGLIFSEFILNSRIESQKKSIAVLPFINDSKDPENIYFINGVMESILDNLSKIKDLEVHPRTSVEQFRNNKNKTIRQIGHELNVNYIIEGSGQKIGDQVSLTIQLIEVRSDKHLFSQRYNMKLEDIFNLQSDVALKVASEIKAAITVKEKELIERVHTTNIDALNLFLQANDIHSIAKSEGMWELDIKAERLYRKAIQLDSAYADPYVALGWIVKNRNLDSAMYLTNRALHFDPKNPEAYTLKGNVYAYTGKENEAEEAYLQSIEYKPNNSPAFCNLGELYFFQGNCYNAIKNQLKAIRLENNLMQECNNLESLCWSLYSLGFYSEGEKYAARLVELDNDSSSYYWGLATVELDLGNYKSALNTALKMYACNTENLDNIYLLFYTYLYLRDFKEADILMQKYIAITKKQGKRITPDYLFGFVDLQNGRIEEADYHFNGTIDAMLKSIEQNQPSATCRAYMVLAKISSVRGEKSKALEYLRKVNECMGITVFRIKDYKNCTMFDNIRQEPGFNDYLQVAGSRFRTEHQKVEQLLRDEGVLISSI